MSSPPLPPDLLAQMMKDTEGARVVLGEIAAFLADAPLYRRYRYAGSLWRRVDGIDKCDLPSEIKLFCSGADCGRAQIWEGDAILRSDYRGNRRVQGFNTLEFVCRNCQQSKLTIFLRVDISSSVLTPANS